MSDDEQEPARERRAARTVLLAFAVGVAGAVFFMVVFSMDARTQLLGIGLTIALGGLGYGLVVWGHRLMPGGGAVEERELMYDPADQREAAEYFEHRTGGIQRRRLLGGAFAAALGASGLAVLFPLRSLGPRPGDALRRSDFAAAGPRPRLVTADGLPVHVSELSVGGFLTVFPEGFPGSANAQTALVRLDTDQVDLRPPTVTEWVVEGYVAYSKVCTHAGCPVGEYQVDSLELFCPCHQSSFLVDAGAVPKLGPAARALPQLPLGLDDEGFLVALSDYQEAVGPGWWTRP